MADVGAKRSTAVLRKLYDGVISDNLSKVKGILREERHARRLNERIAGESSPILHVAVRNSSSSMVELLLRKGARPGLKTENEGENCLHAVAEADRCDLVDAMLEHVDVDEATELELTALHIAVRSGHQRMVELLLAKGARVNTRSSNGNSPLHEAAYDRCVPLIDLLLSHGADPNCLNEGKLSPFHLCFRLDDVSVTQLFLRHGADLQLRAKYGSSPLHLAAMYRSRQQVRFLLDAGANVNESDDFRYSPLQMAIKSVVECPADAVMDIVRLLVDRGADVNALDQYGESALHSAIRMDNLELVEYLVSQAGATLRTSKTSSSALIVAIETGRARLVEYLFESATRDDFRDELDKGVLVFAINRVEDRAERCAIVKRLLEASADTYPALNLAIAENDLELFSMLMKSRLASDGTTQFALQSALMTAVSRRNAEIAEILINLGASVDGFDSEIGTVLCLAVRRNDVRMVRLLLDNGADPNDKFALTDAVHFRCTNMLEIIAEYGAVVDLSSKVGYHALVYAVSDCQVEAVEYLLEKGVNVGAKKSRRVPLHVALRWIDNYDSNDKLEKKRRIVFLMAKHVALLVSQRRFVHSATMKLIRSRDWVLGVYQMYERELARMKATEVCTESKLTYFDVIARSHRDLARFLRCRDVLIELELGDREKLFPSYFEVIRSKYERGLERLKLMNRFDSVLDDAFDKKFPCIVKNVIIGYLTDSDLNYCFRK